MSYWNLELHPFSFEGKTIPHKRQRRRCIRIRVRDGSNIPDSPYHGILTNTQQFKLTNNGRRKIKETEGHTIEIQNFKFVKQFYLSCQNCHLKMSAILDLLRFISFNAARFLCSIMLPFILLIGIASLLEGVKFLHSILHCSQLSFLGKSLCFVFVVWLGEYHCFLYRFVFELCCNCM